MKGRLVITGKKVALMTGNNYTAIGIIAEDKSDVTCLSVLIHKICPDKTIILQGRGMGGGGNMFNATKMLRQIQAMADDGCQHLVIIHDLDRNDTGELNDENNLRNRLQQTINGCKIVDKCIVIPIEEIEAWLLSEQYDHPQQVHNPKSILRKTNKNYKTSDNPKYAQKIDISLIAKKCPSFKPLQEFIMNL
jgi:hypothetical protein